MKKKITWLLLSCLMVVALVLASCGPAVTEEETAVVTEEEEEEVAAEEEEEEEEAEGPEMVRDSLGRLVEKPRYGGVFRQIFSGETTFMDQVQGYECGVIPWALTNENLGVGDYLKGPVGSNESSYTIVSGVLPVSVMTGFLADNWEIVDATTIIYHIRKGIHWQNKPPTNGRELTADDVVFSLLRQFQTPTAYIAGVFPYDQYIESITATDKYTVVVKAKDPDKMGAVFFTTADNVDIVPRDAVELHGDLTDWKNYVGTGPFIVEDHVQASSWTFVRNPNYWQNDPLHPENQLPYLDGVMYLIIPDLSTQIAAMRTGKGDMLIGVGWEDADDFKRTSPQLQYFKVAPTGAAGISPRVDKPELPWYDINVRRALSMAIDYQLISDSYYGGDTELLSYPVANYPEFSNVFTPLEELPESVQELYSHNPEKAKQMLADAGYPDGFQMEVLSTAGAVDLLSIIKDMWARVNVELIIDVKDTPVWYSIAYGKQTKHATSQGGWGSDPFILPAVDAGSMVNTMAVNDPRIQADIAEMSRLVFDTAERERVARELSIYILDQVYKWVAPAPYNYTFYQPWLMRYNGERTFGYCNLYDFATYIWMDQDLKEEMTGKR